MQLRLKGSATRGRSARAPCIHQASLHLDAGYVSAVELLREVVVCPGGPICAFHKVGGVSSEKGTSSTHVTDTRVADQDKRRVLRGSVSKRALSPLTHC